MSLSWNATSLTSFPVELVIGVRFSALGTLPIYLPTNDALLWLRMQVNVSLMLYGLDMLDSTAAQN